MMTEVFPGVTRASRFQSVLPGTDSMLESAESQVLAELEQSKQRPPVSSMPEDDKGSVGERGLLEFIDRGMPTMPGDLPDNLFVVDPMRSLSIVVSRFSLGAGVP